MSKQTKNSYEAKLEARRCALEERAKKATECANRYWEQERELGKNFPSGQPVLVGHYSEKRHRRYIETLRTLDRKAIAEESKAQHYRERAVAVGKGGVSSEDPEAVSKLEEHLRELERQQMMMKEFNKAYRKHKSESDLRAALAGKLPIEAVESGLALDSFGRVKFPFPSFELTNNGANIRRIKARLEELRALDKVETKEVAGSGYTYVQDADDHRVYFVFDGKPSEEVRSLLKSCGFVWAPSLGAWSRKLSANAMASGQHLRTRLDAMMAS